MKKAILFLAVLALSSVFFGCKRDDPKVRTDILCVYYYHNNTYVEIFNGDTFSRDSIYTVRADIMDKDGNNITSGRLVTWTSSKALYAGFTPESSQSGSETAVFSITGNPVKMETGSVTPENNPVTIKVECAGLRKELKLIIEN